MFKRLLPLLICLLAVPAHAIPPPYAVAMPAGTPMVSGTPGQAVSAAVDKYGNQQVVLVAPGGTGASQSVIPVSGNPGVNGIGSGLVGWYRVAQDTSETGSTETVINATAHVAKIGDAVQFSDGGAGSLNAAAYGFVTATTANTITISPALNEAATNGNNFVIQRPTLLNASDPVQSTRSGLGVVVDSGFRLAGASSQGTNLLKLEDAAAATGDALVGVAGVINTSLTSPAANGDYAALALGGAGQSLSSIVYDSAGLSATTQAAIAEDVALTTGSAGLKVFGQLQDPLSVDAATGDAGFHKLDLAGRTITTLAPAGEMWRACSAVATNTADTEIKPFVASNKIYVTAINCVNTSAVASAIQFKDASLNMTYGGVGTQAATGGVFAASYPVPLVTQSGQNFRFAMETTATATRCCASGYISVN